MNTPVSDPLYPLAQRIKQCRVCSDCPRYGPPMPRQPRPIFQLGSSARICIASQAPGNKAYHKGLPFYDPSGVRLREWLAVTEEEFYDPERFAILPMGFCFPGYDAKGGDLPPRRECAEVWREQVFSELPKLELILVIGQYAQKYHLAAADRGRTLTDTVANWRALLGQNCKPAVLPLPHPSWRNNAWLKKNPWFEQELLPVLKREVATLIR
ncbi:MAG: uracil-DNA glycosylase family protein [Oleiphilaceae bacterium]|nr:uracil-DNA glycosylase family protein [Oleiphilaceae bacterium]